MVTPLSIASLLRAFETRLPASMATVVAVVFVCAELLLTVFLNCFGALGAATLASLTGAFAAGRFTTDLPAAGLRDDAVAGFLTADFLPVLADAALLVALFLPTALFGTTFFDAASFIEALFIEAFFAVVFFAADALPVAGLAAALMDLADFLATGFDAPVVARALAATFLTTGPFAAPTRVLDFALPGFALPGFVLLAAMVKLVLFGSAGACYSSSVWQRQPLKSLD